MKQSSAQTPGLSWLPPARWFLLASLAYLLVTLIATSHNYHSLLSMGVQRDWSQVFHRVAPNWLIWALLTPFIVRFTQHYPWNESKRWQCLLTQLTAAVVFLALNWLLIASYVYLFINPEQQLSFGYVLSRYFANPFHIHWGVYLGTVTACFLLQYYRSFHQSQLRTQQLEKGLLKAELQALKSQLNPHFLLNTLNAIVSLIRTEDKTKALQATNQLSQLLRFVLQTQQQEAVPLRHEWQFMDLYFALQRLRFGERLQLDIALDEQLDNCLVPPLLLQPLFENAIEHSCKLVSATSTIAVRISLDPDQQMVTVLVQNSYASHNPRQGFGIGLSNTRARLQAFFGPEASLKHGPSGPDHYTTTLRFPMILDAKEAGDRP
ncbi:sensor histidine kinase [Alkalimonas amylolytica]|uniref:Histidine kinase n=1 Tax=Alkalimonas amylolytica TaxID=152573 RepID=A0A1H4EIX7_ALKAM|nr:histidine kinase [Alkalimonas amylolytica]SEA84973.1 Histidine kinase [Alkalimonas amylolytica]